jgi:hypothetical protein
VKHGLSLTGVPLIVLALAGAVAALAGTVVLWNRGRRLRLLLRAGGVLLAETLLLLGVGLVVNRSEQFYPTWAALSQTGRTAGKTYAAAPGRLDASVLADAGADLDRSVAFAWQPAGWAGWHLAGPPTVVTPTGYLRHPTWRYSALLVIGSGRSTAAAAAAEDAAARDTGTVAGAAIIVFARATSATTADDLAAALPAALTHDVRVTGRRWALVASAADAGLARRTVAVAPARYVAVKLLPSRAALRTALIWACEQTPPPLAPSTPAVTWLPVHHRKPHPAAHPSPTGRPGTDMSGGTRVPGQLGR